MKYLPTATPLPLNRIVAWLIDWLCILVWVAVTAAVAVPLYLAGALHLDNPVAQNVVASLVIVVPVTVTVAVLESGTAAASVGKRFRRLVVMDIDTRLPLTLPRSLLRSSLKIALPWLCAHVGVYGFLNAGGGSPPGGRSWRLLRPTCLPSSGSCPCSSAAVAHRTTGRRDQSSPMWRLSSPPRGLDEPAPAAERCIERCPVTILDRSRQVGACRALPDSATGLTSVHEHSRPGPHVPWRTPKGAA